MHLYQIRYLKMSGYHYLILSEYPSVMTPRYLDVQYHGLKHDSILSVPMVVHNGSKLIGWKLEILVCFQHGLSELHLKKTMLYMFTYLVL